MCVCVCECVCVLRDAMLQQLGCIFFFAQTKLGNSQAEENNRKKKKKNNNNNETNKPSNWSENKHKALEEGGVVGGEGGG